MNTWKLSLLSLVLLFSNCATRPNPTQKSAKQEKLRTNLRLLLAENPQAASLFKIDQNEDYTGLSEDGMKALKTARDLIRKRFELFDKEFKNLRGIHFAATMARISEGNMFLYGPPGGAKSGVVSWMMKPEGDVYVRQMHQMMTEQGFIGGEVLEKTMKGETEINTKGSLVEYKVALLDEIEKGNPAVLASLLSLLNERTVLAGNRTIHAKTETVYATSNASLPEFFDSFVESGQRSTAPALLNRFQYKAFVYNWIDDAHQRTDLDKRRAKKKYQDLLRKNFPNISKKNDFESAPLVDWAQIRDLARILVQEDLGFDSAFQPFISHMRDEVNAHIKQSQEAHASNPRENPTVYFPSFDYTERNRQQVPDIVRYSLFLDFLLSPQSDDSNLRYYAHSEDASRPSKTIDMSALSLWRASAMLTTVSMGNPHLVSGVSCDSEDQDTCTATKQGTNSQKTQEESPYAINFDMRISSDKARDKREQALIENIQFEQNLFNRIFKADLTEINRVMAESAQNGFDTEEDGVNFEMLRVAEHNNAAQEDKK